MTTQIAVRLDETEIAALDAEVAAGRVASRSDAVRHGIARLKRDQRYRGADEILADRRAVGATIGALLDDQEAELARAISDAFELHIP